MKALKYLAIMAIAVAGCNSFNKVEIRGPVILGHTPTSATESQKEEPQAEELAPASTPLADPVVELLPTKPIPVPQVRPVVVNKGCPVYKAPTLPSKPELPYKELERLRQDNKREAADFILLDHIDKLRAWAVSVEKTLADSQKKYVSDCKRWQRATNP